MIFPDRVELGFWRIWRNYLLIFLIGIIVGGVGVAIGYSTDWYQALWNAITGR